MLKFLRKYMSFLLVIFSALLMVVFLIEPVVNKFSAGMSAVTVGKIGDEKISSRELQQSAVEVQLLGRMGLLAPVSAPDPLQWTLMKFEARQIGVDVAASEVDQQLHALLRARLGEKYQPQDFDRQLLILANQIGVTVDQMALAMHDLIRVSKAIGIIDATDAQGLPRVSLPLVEQLVDSLLTTARVTAVPIGYQQYMDKVGQPDEAMIQTLYDDYRDLLPGDDSQYGFGYRTPDRVKFEYLRIPLERLLDKITVRLHEAKAYYDENPQMFTETTGEGADAKTQVVDFTQVRQLAIEMARRKKAQQLGREMISRAQEMLTRQLRDLSIDKGYRVIPQGFDLMPLSQVQSQLQEEFGVLADVRRLDDRWYDPRDFATIPGVIDAKTTDARPVNFTTYIMSVRELDPKVDTRLLSRRLQVGVPSQVMESPDSYLVFRVIDAQQSAAPESLEQVRAQVEQDAKKLAAYRMLLADRDTWLEKARGEDLEKFAHDNTAPLIGPTYLARREATPPRFALDVPQIPQVGKSQTAVDGIFAMAQQAYEKALDAGQTSPTMAPVLGAFPVDQDLSLLIAKVDEYRPLTQQQFEQVRASMQLQQAIGSVLAAGADNDMSEEALKDRLGFVSTEERREKPNSESN